MRPNMAAPSHRTVTLTVNQPPHPDCAIRGVPVPSRRSTVVRRSRPMLVSAGCRIVRWSTHRLLRRQLGKPHLVSPGAACTWFGPAGHRSRRTRVSHRLGSPNCVPDDSVPGSPRQSWWSICRGMSSAKPLTPHGPHCIAAALKFAFAAVPSRAMVIGSKRSRRLGHRRIGRQDRVVGLGSLRCI